MRPLTFCSPEILATSLFLASAGVQAAAVEVEAQLVAPAGAAVVIDSPATLEVEAVPTPANQPVKKNTLLLQLDREQLEKTLLATQKALESAQREKRRMASDRQVVSSQPTSQSAAAMSAANEYARIESEERNAMSELTQLQTQMAQVAVRAGADGYVTRHYYAAAAKARRRKPLLEFVDATKVVLEASIPAAVSEPFAAGSTVRVAATEGEVRTFTGRILSATPAGEQVALRIQPLDLPFLALGAPGRVAISLLP